MRKRCWVYSKFYNNKKHCQVSGWRWMIIELVVFCFSQTECFSLQILSQTINTVAALDKPALLSIKIRFNFVSLNVLANVFFAFFCRPTDPTLTNHINEKYKNKWGWPKRLAITKYILGIIVILRTPHKADLLISKYCTTKQGRG